MFATKPTDNNRVCVKEIINGYEISAAFDNSGGAFDKLVRGDVRIWRVDDDEDVTELFFPGVSTVIANIENLALAAHCARKLPAGDKSNR